MTNSGSIEYPITLNEVAVDDRIGDYHALRLFAGTHVLTANLAPTFTGQNVTIKPAIGTSPVIDVGAYDIGWSLNNTGPFTIRDLEICSLLDESREFTTETFPSMQRGRASLPGYGSTMINCRIHDIENHGWAKLADGGVMDSCDIYNIGYMLDGETGGGHSMYAQNNEANDWKVIRNCIFGGSLGFVLALKGSGNTEVYNFLIENCIFLGGDMRFGQDGAPGGNIIVRNCAGWRSRFMFDGFAAGSGTNITIHNNYWESPDQQYFAIMGSSIQNNTIIMSELTEKSLLFIRPREGNTWNNNAYIRNGDSISGDSFVIVNDEQVGYTFAGWQVATGYDADSTISMSLPTENVQFVYACQLPRVAHIAVFNWEELETVDVDVSALGMTTSGNYRLRNAYDPLEDYDDFVYDGSGTVTVSFVGRGNAVPLGAVDPILTLDARFGAWILEKI